MICLTSKQASQTYINWGKLLCVQASRLFPKQMIFFMDVRWILRLIFLATKIQLHQIPTLIAQFPKGTVLNSQLNPWTAKYAFMGLAMSGTDQPANDGKTVSLAITDGINEAGLSGDIQYLMESSTAPAESLADRGLTPHIAEEVLAYILSNFESVDEVKVAFEKIGLLDQKFQLDSLGEVHFTLHWTINDKNNNSIVLQPTDNGAFVIYDSIGVVTNSPEYNYHLTNARNYIGMRNYAIKEPYTLKSGATLDPIEGGTSYGLLGIPGDFTSPSRFIRALYFSDNLQEFDSSEGIMQLYRAFQTVMIPRGIGHLGQSNSLSDFTHYWSGYDVTNLTMYVQPESTTSFTKYTLDPALTEVTTFAVSNELLLTDLNQ